MLPPVALNGPVITIRRFPKNPIHMDRLVELALKRRREESRLHTSFDTNLLQNARLGGAKPGKKV